MYTATALPTAALDDLAAYILDEPSLPPTAPLQVSSEPWPGDIRLVVHVQPGAPLGFLDLHLGLGRGTKGKGQRPGDDHATYVATLHRLAQHIATYAQAYDDAAREDQDQVAQ